VKVGGKQRIETPDGYIIPLNVRNGLLYMTIRPFTDYEWDILPHVVLTADVDWDPSILDFEQEKPKSKNYKIYNFCPDQENHKSKNNKIYNFCLKKQKPKSKNYKIHNFCPSQEHPVLWKFNKTIGHQGSLSNQHKSNKGSSYKV